VDPKAQMYISFKKKKVETSSLITIEYDISLGREVGHDSWHTCDDINFGCFSPFQHKNCVIHTIVWHLWKR
jgi:hypothetical protein